MPAKRQILDLLTRDELAQLVEEHRVIVGGRAKGHLADQLDAKGPALATLLSGLSRDRLKELCRQLDLDDGGREKAP
jgi:type I restriction enzyme M protein